MLARHSGSLERCAFNAARQAGQGNGDLGHSVSTRMSHAQPWTVVSIFVIASGVVALGAIIEDQAPAYVSVTL